MTEVSTLNTHDKPWEIRPGPQLYRYSTTLSNIVSNLAALHQQRKYPKKQPGVSNQSLPQTNTRSRPQHRRIPITPLFVKTKNLSSIPAETAKENEPPNHLVTTTEPTITRTPSRFTLDTKVTMVRNHRQPPSPTTQRRNIQAFVSHPFTPHKSKQNKKEE